MRVLHVHSGNLYGGVERVLEVLAACRGQVPELEQHFALCFSGRAMDELRQAGADVHELGVVRARSPLSILRARRALERVLAAITPDLVISHSPWSQGLFGPVVRRDRLPSVMWRHDAGDGRHWVDRWARRTPPDLVVCNSHFTRSRLPLLYPSVPSDVIYCPVWPPPPLSSEHRLALREALGTTADAVVIVQVSRMEPLKGHTVHLQALASLTDDERWTCWMVGGAQRPAEHAYAASLGEVARKLGIERRVRFIPRAASAAELIAAADVYCQPNLGPEGFGITFVEALGAGLPVVTTPLGAAPEVLSPTCGRLVPPGDADELAAVLRNLILDPGERRALGAPGPARARELSDPAARLRQLHDLLAGVLARRREATREAG